MAQQFGMFSQAGTFAGKAMNSTAGRQFSQGVMETFGFEYKKGVNMGFLGKNSPGGMLGEGKFAFGSRVFGLAMIGLSAYNGYQEGGVTGAVGSVAKDAAMWGAMRAGWSLGKGALMNPFVLGGAAALGLGYAGYKIGEAARERSNRIRHIEMGGEIIDRFGTLSTIRQRSLMALNNSHVNGRMALGNEAILMHPNLR